MPRKKSSAKKPAKPGHQTLSNTILDTDGRQTFGLKSGKTAQPKKEVGRYQVQPQTDVAGQFEQEKERAAQKQALLEGLRPGSTAPAGADFSGASLINQDLQRMRFNNSVMRRCKFSNSQLAGVHWKNCDLRGVNCRHADLRDAIFDGCNLNGADLRHADLTNARIIDCDLSAANFDCAVLDKAVIEGCDMAAQTFHKTSCREIGLYNSQILHGFFDHADFTHAEIQGMTFRHCTLTGALFDHASISTCSFKGCESFADGPSFAHASIKGTTLADCEFQSINLSNTKVAGGLWERVSLRDAQLDNTAFNQVDFSEGFLTDCFSMKKAPSFDQCHLDHLVIAHTDLTNAVFRTSHFVGATIRDCDVNQWQFIQTDIDAETIIDDQ